MSGPIFEAELRFARDAGGHRYSALIGSDDYRAAMG